MKAAKIELNAPIINMGSNATQAAVLGNTLVGSVLTPAFTTLITAMNVLAADPLLTPASKAAMQAAATALTGIISNVSAALSAQVKLTG
jgi:hypothetical protein